MPAKAVRRFRRRGRSLVALRFQAVDEFELGRARTRPLDDAAGVAQLPLEGMQEPGAGEVQGLDARGIHDHRAARGARGLAQAQPFCSRLRDCPAAVQPEPASSALVLHLERHGNPPRIPGRC